MPYFVNGQLVTEESVRRESDRLARDPRWREAPEQQRAAMLRAAAEQAAIDRLLIEQQALADPRPIPPEAIDHAMERLQSGWGCNNQADLSGMRPFLERQARIARLEKEINKRAHEPTSEEVEAFYLAHPDGFPTPEGFHAAHVVKFVNGEQSEAAAYAGILEARAALDAGETLASVADRLSDCSDKAGDLGRFPANKMEESFEEALRALQPGERSPIVRTSRGFHIAELIQFFPVGRAPLEEAREDIYKTLYFANRNEAWKAVLAELRAHADIRWSPTLRATG